MISIWRAMRAAVLFGGSVASLGCCTSARQDSLEKLATEEPTQGAVDDALGRGGPVGRAVVIGLLESDWVWTLYRYLDKQPERAEIYLNFYAGMLRETGENGVVTIRPGVPKPVQEIVIIRDPWLLEWARRVHPERCVDQGH